MPATSPLSTAARSIGASVTLQLNASAARMRAEGEPVIHLGGGEPESKAPAPALAAGIDLLNTGEVRYTPASGTPAMKDAVIAYTDQFYGRQIERTNVMASAGVKQALMVALMALLDPGDEVVFPVPYWVSYPEMARIAGGVPVPVALEEGQHHPTVAAMEAALTDRTRAVILNSPSNPSGLILDKEFLTAVIALCQARGIMVLMDDIYHRLVFGGKITTLCYDCTDKSVDEAGVLVLNGVSKQYAMTGFRIGWAVGPVTLIKAMSNIQSHLSGGPCTISQASAVAALTGDQSSVENLRDDLEERRNETAGLLESIPGVKLKHPDGTFYCFADFSAFDADSTRLSSRFLDKVQVVTVPGVEFGMEGYLRISFCGAMADVREGVRRMRWLLNDSGAAELKAGGRVFSR
ncbi:MAG: pyridoxal phosphate-dependent aminotransferase [Candidatus Krumholzibacteria bacterium]|nr:pyridoxal phosphate-dependent aminotransferase [Candidatus Krumholzibacteria bacterium]